MLSRWRDLIGEALRQATLTAWVGLAGPWPFLRPELRNTPMVGVGFVWVGDPDEGRGLLGALRDGTHAVAEEIEELTYLELQTIEDERQRQPMRRYGKGHYIREFGDDAIEAFVSIGREGDRRGAVPLPAAGLQSYGGAIAEVGADETAFSHRDALVEFVTLVSWLDPEEDETRMSAARRVGAAIEPFASGVYVNALADDGDAGVERAYGSQKLVRLAALKARYDPENVFHLNHNIRPDGGGAG